MTKNYLTPSQQKEIKKNPYVKAVSDKAITYTDEFKRLFITENEVGKLPREIFEEAGFNIDMMGMTRVNRAADRWKRAYKKQGITGLEDSRKYSSGRPLDSAAGALEWHVPMREHPRSSRCSQTARPIVPDAPATKTTPSSIMRPSFPSALKCEH